MKINLLWAALCIAGALGNKEKAVETIKITAEPKPKREAPVAGGGGYHGPSYKYLPPSSAGHTVGFDSYSSGHHSAGVDFGSYEGAGGVHGREGVHFGSPKVETYIIRTVPAYEKYGSNHVGGPHDVTNSHGLSKLHGYSGSHGFGGNHGEAGYKYAGPSSSFSAGHISHQQSFGGLHSHGHGQVHKIKAIFIPAHSGHTNSGYDRFNGHKTGYSYSKDSVNGPHYSSNPAGYYNGHGANNADGYITGHLSVSDFSGVHGPQGYEQSHDYSTNSLEASYRDNEQTKSQGGYSYEIPHSIYSLGHSQGSYAAPSFSSSPYNGDIAGQQAPAYAAGHKGLGHFGYAASKPQALNTNFIDSGRYDKSSSSHNAVHGASSAPFKASLFLGASHEGGSTSSGVSSEYGPPAGNQNISPQYLPPPPTSNNYDYPPPSALYEAPATGAVHEPENTYLPPTAPQTSYGPPATPGDSYLTPHH